MLWDTLQFVQYVGIMKLANIQLDWLDNIISASLIEVKAPLNKVIIKPILTKTKLLLDTSEQANRCLMFLYQCKLIAECLLAKHLQGFLDYTNVLDHIQFCFRPNNTTEIALVGLVDNFLG